MKVHRREIDLTAVEDMDEQEYQDLLKYVAQWDTETASQLEEIKQAREEKPKVKKAHTPKT